MLTGEHELYAMAKYTLMKYNVQPDDDLIQELVLYALQNEKYFDESKGGRKDYYIFFAMERRLKQIWSTKNYKKRNCGVEPFSLDYPYKSDGKRYRFLYDIIPDTYDFKEEFHKQELVNELMVLVEEPLKMWLDGLTYIDIGEKLGCSRVWAKVLIQKNIEKIKQYCKSKNIWY